MCVYDKNTRTSILSLNKSSYFGDFQLFLNIKSNYRFMAGEGPDEVQLYCIRGEKLQSIMDIHQREAEFLVLRAKKRYLYFKRVRNEIRQ